MIVPLRKCNFPLYFRRLPLLKYFPALRPGHFVAPVPKVSMECPNKETVSEFQIFYRQIAIFLKKYTKSEKAEKQFKIRNRAHTNYGKSIKKIDLSSNEDIIRLFEKLKEEAENNYVDFEKLFGEFRKAVKPDDYVNHLNMLINLEPGLLDFYSYEKALVAAIKEWSIYPSVITWKKISFTPFLKSKFAHYFSNGYVSVKTHSCIHRNFG